MYNVHKVQMRDDPRKILQCPHCPYSALLRSRFNDHLETHSEARAHVCPDCNKSFRTKCVLKSHRQWLHSDKVFSCTQCSYQTKTSVKLNEHVRVQHQLKNVKPYQCPYCPFKCATGGNTRKHVMNKHKGLPVRYISDTIVIDVAKKARELGHVASLDDIIPKIDNAGLTHVEGIQIFNTSNLNLTM